jgi:hypothetical protein
MDQEKMIAMLQHGFSTFLYWMTGYALINALGAGLWAIRARHLLPALNASDVEVTIQTWLDDFDLSTKSASDASWNFGLLTTSPDGESIHIIQMKQDPGFIVFYAKLAISAEHQAILKAMPKAYFENLAQEVVLGVFLAKIALAMQTRVTDITFFSQLAMIDLNESNLLRHINNIDSAIILARRAILLGVERAPRLVGPREDPHGGHRGQDVCCRSTEVACMK